MAETWFSRIRLNPARRDCQYLLASPQRVHAAVLAAHPLGTSAEGGEARVLWRVDRPERHRVDLYVASPSRPDFEHLMEQAGWPTVATAEVTDYGPFLRRLTKGQTFQFRLTANPVRSLKRQGSARGVVSPHITATSQLDWLLSRCSDWGFAVPLIDGEPTARVVGRGTNQFGRVSRDVDGARRRDAVAVSTATFDGVLEVADAERLRTALVVGMGRAKAYGCGLMTLAPVTTKG